MDHKVTFSSTLCIVTYGVINIYVVQIIIHINKSHAKICRFRVPLITTTCVVVVFDLNVNIDPLSLPLVRVQKNTLWKPIPPPPPPPLPPPLLTGSKITTFCIVYNEKLGSSPLSLIPVSIPDTN